MCNICSIWTISRQFGIVRLRIFLYLWERNCKNVQSAYDIKKYIKYPLFFLYFLSLLVFIKICSVRSPRYFVRKE